MSDYLHTCCSAADQRLSRLLILVDHYSVLGVAVMDHSATELKRAYKKTSLKHHPDRQGGSTEAFQLVATAHTVLADPVTRQAYDEGSAVARDVLRCVYR